MHSWLSNRMSAGMILMLLIPVWLVLSGIYQRFGYTDDPNPAIGYRTGRSMKSRESWALANRMSGKLRIFTGVLGILLVMVLGNLVHRSQTGIATVMFAEWIIWHLLYIPVEQMLREREKNRKN